MKKLPIRSAVKVALGTTMIGVLSAGVYAATDTSPFAMKNLSGGYMVADNLDDSGGGMKGKEGKCGEGKCGGMKGKEGKCGGKKSGHKWFGGKMTPMAPPSSIDCTYDEDICS